MDPAWTSAFGNATNVSSQYGQFGYAQTASFGTNSQLNSGPAQPSQEVSLPMLQYYAQQAAQHALRHPGDPQAVMQAQFMQQQYMAAQAAAMAQASAAGAPPQGQAPVPSNLTGPQAPTPPMTQQQSGVEIPASWGFNQSQPTLLGMLPCGLRPRPPQQPRSLRHRS